MNSPDKPTYQEDTLPGMPAPPPPSGYPTDAELAELRGHLNAAAAIVVRFPLVGSMVAGALGHILEDIDFIDAVAWAERHARGR
jgi:hypothetical protein